MNDAAPDPKKVVRRVVKKTVVKPVAAPRHTVPTAQPQARTDASPAVRRSTTVTQPRPATAATPVKERRPSVDLSGTAGKVGGAVTGGVGKATGAVAGGFSWLRDAVLDAVDAIRAWRIPTVEPIKASLISGLICGLVLTILGYGLIELFDYTRGVHTGGRWWGGLSIAVLSVLAYFFGHWLLRSFGLPASRAISFLGLLLMATLLATFFSSLAYGVWAFLIVPLLTAACFLVAERIIALAQLPED